MEEKKLLLIVNPRSGKTKPRGPLFDAVGVFSDAGYLVKVHVTTGPGDAAETAAQLGPDFDTVVCVGGDGTLSETAGGLMRLADPPPLGYLPRGSTNDYAASLALPEDPVAAAKLAATAQPRKLDIGRWNQRHFVYVASFGAFARSSYSASQSAKNALGHFAYNLEGMRDLNTLRPYQLNITADGENLDGEYLFGAVCNSTSIAGLMKLEKETVVMDDGYFELLLIPSPKNAMDLNNLLSALINQEYDHNGLIFRHIRTVRLAPKEELPWALDGEYAPAAEMVEIENRRQALSFLMG
jgi:YegS/Rv2252/BmrU family lipid kinase